MRPLSSFLPYLLPFALQAQQVPPATAGYMENLLWYNPAYAGAPGRPVVRLTGRDIAHVTGADENFVFRGLTFSGQASHDSSHSAAAGVIYSLYDAGRPTQKLGLPLSYVILRNGTGTWIRLGVQPHVIHQSIGTSAAVRPELHPGKRITSAAVFGVDAGAWMMLDDALFVSFAIHHLTGPVMRYRYTETGLGSEVVLILGLRLRPRGRAAVFIPSVGANLAVEDGNESWKAALSCYLDNDSYVSFYAVTAGLLLPGTKSQTDVELGLKFSPLIR